MSRWWRAAPRSSRPRRKTIRDETGRKVFTVAADIRKAADCERIIAEPLKHFGRLDILVNNDGAPPLGELMSFDDAAWDKAWQQNFMSVVRLTRGADPGDAQGGRRAHRQHHGALGAAADAEIRALGRDLGRRDRLRQDALARSRGRQHHRQHDLPGPLRDRRLAKVFGRGAKKPKR